jgi:hypothetical protein
MPRRNRLGIQGQPLFATGRGNRLWHRRCRRLEAIKPLPVIFPRPVEQHLDRVLHLVVRSTKRQANRAGGIESREVLASRVPGAPVGLHDLAHRARRQPPRERLSLPVGWATLA